MAPAGSGHTSSRRRLAWAPVTGGPPSGSCLTPPIPRRGRRWAAAAGASGAALCATRHGARCSHVGAASGAPPAAARSRPAAQPLSARERSRPRAAAPAPPAAPSAGSAASARRRGWAPHVSGGSPQGHVSGGRGRGGGGARRGPPAAAALRGTRRRATRCGWLAAAAASAALRCRAGEGRSGGTALCSTSPLTTRCCVGARCVFPSCLARTRARGYGQCQSGRARVRVSIQGGSLGWC